MNQKRRLPPISPQELARHRDQLQQLYGSKALPKDPAPEPAPAPPAEPERQG